MKLRMLFSVLWVACSIGASAQVVLLKKLDRFTNNLSSEFGNLNSTKKAELNSFADAIVNEKMNSGNASVLFSSNDNSSLSHIYQVWLQVALDKFGVKNITTSSAGLVPNVITKETISVLKASGFNITSNPISHANGSYVVRYSWSENELLMFSKKSDNYQIPTKSIVLKDVDDTILNQSNASEISKQIAIDMMYVAEKIHNNHLLSLQ